MSTPFKSGYAALTGRPNVGKSTLMNAILGEKIAIVSPKPQTTRNRILGVKTVPGAQVVFLDTPGLHKPKHRLGERLVETARESAGEGDIILCLVEPELPGKGFYHVKQLLEELGKPVFLVINKMDTIKKPALLPIMEAYGKLYAFAEIVPVSALKGEGIDRLTELIIKYLPEGPMYYPEDSITDSTIRFMASELIREKIMYRTGEEVPYSIAVDITEWKEEEDGPIFIHADIYVEREGQKGIIIGKGGEFLKTVGTHARQEIEALAGKRVYLEMRVKLKKDWRSDKNILKELGFE